jgi:diaminohydroxyphosphoribosylaminopyrimidine deaminase/5-amino-6-(5-phosphoribosylamino)uracil reductase
MMQRLSELEVNEIHLETGQQLNGAMLEAGLVDEVLLYVAPKWIGTGMGMSLTQPLQRLQDAWALQWIDITPVGPDLRIRAQVLRSAST